MNGNHLTFEGNLVNRLHETDKGKASVLQLMVGPKGTKYLRFAVGRSYMRGTTEEVTFLDCVVFGDQAENFFNSATKGMRILVEGHINQSRWETPDGQKRTKVECVADTIAPVLRWASADVTKNAATPVVAAPVETAIEISESDELEVETEVVLVESPF